MIADKVIKSNVIYTGRGREIISGGVAVKGNEIIAVGSDSEIGQYIGENTEVCEYTDKLVMPGLIDNHVHVTMGAMMHDNDLNLEGTRSAEECAEMVREFLKKHPDTSLLVASGWMVSAWDKNELPRKEILDEVSKDIPTEATEMFQSIKYEDKREVFGFKVHSFSTFEKIKKYDETDNAESAEKPYSIEVGRTKRTINLYAIASTKFQIAV